jgi:hypothetical protein
MDEEWDSIFQEVIPLNPQIKLKYSLPGLFQCPLIQLERDNPWCSLRRGPWQKRGLGALGA